MRCLIVHCGFIERFRCKGAIGFAIADGTLGGEWISDAGFESVFSVHLFMPPVVVIDVGDDVCEFCVSIDHL